MVWLPAWVVTLRWGGLEVRGRFPTYRCFWSNFSLQLRTNKFCNALFKKSIVKTTFNWCQINFLRKFSFLEAFQVFYFCCHSERRPDFEISDFTEWKLCPLLPPVINSLQSNVRDPGIDPRCSCSLKWLLGSVSMEGDWAKHFPRQLASKVSGGPAICYWRKRHGWT